MLRLACGHRLLLILSDFPALIPFSLQVILDPWPAIGNLYKEMKSRRRTLQNLVSLKGRTASKIRQRIKAESQGTAAQRSNRSISGQILPADDWMRWAKMIHGDNSGDSSSFAAKLSP